MSTRRLIFAAFVVFALVIPAFLLVRKHKRSRDLESDLDTAGFQKADCPTGEAVVAIFGRRMDDLRCWSGPLANGKPAELLLATRWKTEGANVPKGSGIAEDSLIGVKVSRADEGFVAGWTARLGRSGDDLPVKVAKLRDSTVIVWRGLFISDLIKRRLDDVTASL